MLLSTFRRSSSRYHVSITLNRLSQMGTFDNQKSLPRLPVPNLKEACEKYLYFVKPFTTPEQHEKTKAAIQKFMSPGGIGEELHAKLVERSKVKENWLEEWWDTEVYYKARIPLVIDTNPGTVAQDNEILKTIPSSRLQTWRAAQIIHSSLNFMKEIQNNTLTPDPKMCMSQYARIFGVSRVPDLKQDKLINYLGNPKSLETKHFLSEYQPSNPNHIVVISKGHFFCLNVFSDGNYIKSVDEIENDLIHIRTKCQSLRHAGSASIGVLTAIDRDTWAKARQALVSLDPTNEQSLHVIQKSLFVLVLDEESPNQSEIARQLLAGDACSRFYDKHMFIVFRNGKAGLTFEHGATDGLTVVRLLDYINSHPSANQFNSELSLKPYVEDQLKWVLSHFMEHAIAAANSAYRLKEKGVDLTTEEFSEFGREEIKALGCSPDAFFQMAMQLAYYKLFGVCVPTYESAATRQFLHGRTETLRSCTPESRDWVQSMTKPVQYSERKKEMQISLLRRALKTHSTNIREATNGNGIDRFFLGCYMLCLESGKPLPEIFTDPTFSASRHYQLSTSSMPTSEVVSFGAVVEDGYGCYYCFPPNTSCIRFAVSSFHGYGHPTLQFAHAVKASLREMAQLLKSEQTEKK